MEGGRAVASLRYDEELEIGTNWVLSGVETKELRWGWDNVMMNKRN